MFFKDLLIFIFIYSITKEEIKINYLFDRILKEPEILEISILSNE